MLVLSVDQIERFNGFEDQATDCIERFQPFEVVSIIIQLVCWGGGVPHQLPAR